MKEKKCSRFSPILVVLIPERALARWLPHIDSEQPVPSRPDRPSYVGIVTSTVLHIVAIGSLSLLLIPKPVNHAIPSLTTGWNKPQDIEAPVEQLAAFQAEPTDTAASASSASFVEIERSPIANIRLPLTVRPAYQAGPLIDTRNLTEPVSPAAGHGTDGNGNGNGGASGPLEFFPIDDKPSRFVFVVDSSQSMNHKYPGPAKSRLGRVKWELWQSIYRMSPEQKYFIVFFNTQAIPMPADRLIPGGMEGQRPYIHWTARIRANGKTDPEDALLLALRLRPDVIFFLTDGEFNYRAVRKVSEKNSGVTIHTIALGDNVGERFLQEIAERNNGTYRFIDSTIDHYWAEQQADADTPETDTALLNSP